MFKSIDFDYYFIVIDNSSLTKFKEIKEKAISNKSFRDRLLNHLIKDLESIVINKTSIYEYDQNVLGGGLSFMYSDEARNEAVTILKEIIKERNLQDEDSEYLQYCIFQKECLFMLNNTWYMPRVGFYFSSEFTDILYNKGKELNDMFSFNQENILYDHIFPLPEFCMSEYRNFSKNCITRIENELKDMVIDDVYNKEMITFKSIIEKAKLDRNTLYLAKKID